MTDDDPATPVTRAPLTRRERWRVVAAGVAPVLLAIAVLAPFGRSVADVLLSAVVYGGLLGLAAAVVAIDRAQSRRCPRCGVVADRGAATCGHCGYDLVRRPRYACAEGHMVARAPGLCACGRRLQTLPPARGVGREVAWVLRFGAWLLAFLLGMGILLRVSG